MGKAGRLKSSAADAAGPDDGPLGKSGSCGSHPPTGKVFSAARAGCLAAAHFLAQLGKRDGPRGLGRCGGWGMGRGAWSATVRQSLPGGRAEGEGRCGKGSGRWWAR